MASYESTVLATSGLVGFWQLGSAEGNEADLTGNGLTAIVQGSPLRAQPSLLSGGEGRSAKFSSGNYFQVAHNALLNLGNVWSMEVWLKLDPAAKAEESQNIASKGNGAYYGRLFPETGFKAQMLRSQTAALARSSSTLAVNTIYHVVFTKTGSTRKVYVNGVDVTTLQTDSTCVNTSAALEIGQKDAGFAGVFEGWMQYLAIYNVAVPLATVEGHYAARTLTATAGSATVTGTGEAEATGTHIGVGTGEISGTGDLSGSGEDIQRAVMTDVSNLSVKSATLNGIINPQGKTSQYWFEYWKESDLLTKFFAPVTKNADPGKGFTPVAVSVPISELEPDTAYAARLRLVSGEEVIVGDTLSFTTLPAPKVIRRKKPDLALDIEVETPDGTFRLPADATKAGNLPRNLSFGTARGEGFGIGSLNLSRDIFKTYPDIGLLDTWRAISRTGRVVYEGRLQSNPRTNDPENLLEIALVGWMSYLAGKKISPLILDSRLGSWEEPSLQRKKQLVEGGFNLSKMGVSSGWQGEAAGPNEAAIIFTPTDWANTKFVGEQWFNGHGEVIEQVLYNFLVLSAGGMAEFLDNNVSIATSDTAAAYTASMNHKTTAASNQKVTRHATDGKYAAIQSLRNGGAFVGESTGDSWAFSGLKVIGNHGLTLQGTWPEVGFWLTDILRYILETYYPKVKLAGKTNNFVVQQGTWHDNAATGYDIAKQLNNLALWELNMWEDRTLYHEPADLTKYDWQFKTTDPGVKVKFQGDTIENFANGCSVQYTDFDGVPHFLSPHDFPQLRDESEDNPANRHNEDLFTDCDVPYPCNETEALQFGAVYLAEFNRPKRPGSYEIQGGYIKDAAGNWHAGWDPRNGETVGIMDLLDDEPRLITTSQWDDESKVLTITVDAADKLLDAIVARQQIARETRGL